MRKTIALRVKLRRGQNDTIGWRVRQRHRSQRKKQHLRRKALELDHKIKGLDTKHVLHNYEEILFFLNCREFPYLHLHNPETLTEFLAECEHLGLYTAALVAAGRLKQLHKALPLLDRPEVCVKHVMRSFYICREWKLLQQIMEWGTFSQNLFCSYVHYIFNKKVIKRDLQEEGEKFIAFLFEKCSRKYQTRLIVRMVCALKITLFRRIRFWKLPFANLKHVCKVVWMLHEMIFHPQVRAKDNLRNKKFLATVIEMGSMSTTHLDFNDNLGFDGLRLGRQLGSIRAIRLAYTLGLARHEVLHIHLRQIQNQGFHIERMRGLLKSEEEGGVVVADRDIRLIQVQEYIQKAAATPRRLEDLCVTRVSQLVGCRQDRAQAVKSLEIAENLRDSVLLKDVCQDLYNERSSDWEPRTDPPGLFYCYKSVQDCRALICSGQ